MPLAPDDPKLVQVIGVSNDELERFTADRQKRLLAVYQRERDVLIHRLMKVGTGDTFGARHMAASLSVLDDAISRLLDELNGVFKSAFVDHAETAAGQAVREVSQLEGAFASASTARAIAALDGVIPHRAIDQVVQLGKFETEGIVLDIDATTKAILQRGLLTGRNSRQLVGELAQQVGDNMDRQAWRLETTLRTGLNAAQARAHNETYTEIRDDLLPDLKRQGHEFLFSYAKELSTRGGRRSRNHPFSAYLEGKVTDLDKPWVVSSPVFPVMFWARDGGAYTGMHYPAHLHERGRQVPYHPAWDASRSQAATRVGQAAKMQEDIEAKIARKTGESQGLAGSPVPGARQRPALGADARREVLRRAERLQRRLDRSADEIASLNRKMRELFGSDDPAAEARMKELTRRQRDLIARRNAIWENQTSIVRKGIEAPTPAAPDITYSGRGPRIAKWKEGAEVFNRLVGPGLVDGQGITITGIPSGKAQRAFYSNLRRTVFQDRRDEPRVIVHEMGHWLEHNARGVQDKAIAFWRRRTQGEPDKRLVDLFPDAGYDKKETTKVDQFIHPYMGKVYYQGGKIAATEVISMGLEELYADPVGFAKRDPDYFDFIYELVREGG